MKDNERGKRLLQFCDAIAPTQTEFAEKLGLAPQALQKYLTGGTIPGTQTLIKLGNMGLNVNWLLNNTGDMIIDTKAFKPRSKPVPIIGEVECGVPVVNQMGAEGMKYLDMFDVSGMTTPFIVIARGDSMSPYINSGDMLLCADDPEKIKKNYKAVLVNFKTTPETYMANAKLIRWNEDDITLYSVNTKYPPVDYKKSEIFKIYKVMRVIREVK